MKTCSKCKAEKSLADFYKKSGRNCLNAKCKACVLQESADRRAQKRDLLIAKDRERYQRDRAKLLEQKKAYAAANKQLIAQKNAEYRKRHGGRLSAYLRDWKAAHPHKLAEYKPTQQAATRAWRKANPEAVTLQEQRRRASKLRAVVAWNPELDDLVLREAASLAKQRERITGIRWSIDHVEPLQSDEVCGLHTASNLAVIPLALNVKKNNRRVANRFWWLDPGNPTNEGI